MTQLHLQRICCNAILIIANYCKVINFKLESLTLYSNTWLTGSINPSLQMCSSLPSWAFLAFLLHILYDVPNKTNSAYHMFTLFYPCFIFIYIILSTLINEAEKSQQTIEKNHCKYFSIIISCCMFMVSIICKLVCYFFANFSSTEKWFLSRF
jgi:hypothetical protein